MIQSTLILAAAIAVFGAVVTVAAAVCWPSRTPEPAPLPVLVLGYRYCPAELRTRAAVQHPDGTATCGDCHAHIPAAEEEDSRA